MLRLPVLVAPGHAEDAVSVHLGYGREGAEGLARGVGANAYLLRTTDAPVFANDIEVRKLRGQKQSLALTQTHFSVEGRPIALSATLAEWRLNPDFAAGAARPPRPRSSLPTAPMVTQWAMTIDTSICTGCGACVVGCQAENNILVVGKEQVLKRREMHWLRIDTYYRAARRARPRSLHQPMLCQHCEKAPCEYVCPVNATVHSPDGLNEMIYNRCVGTRFCSNNCPYKVRRFNWFDWNEHEPDNQAWSSSSATPTSPCASAGVMEKCTYCVQRIRGAEIARANRAPADPRRARCVTACQQACPTQRHPVRLAARTPTPRWSQWRSEPRSFAVLHELGHPARAPQYLARIDNPNPEIG